MRFTVRRFALAFLVLVLLAGASMTAPVSAAETTQIKQIEEDCLVIFIDGQNLGEDVAKEKWQWIVDTYGTGGEKLNLAATDWYYYASPPLGLGHPLESKNVSVTIQWLQSFLGKVGRTDFPWERIFIYDANANGTYTLEANALGYSDSYFVSQPDGAFASPYGNPFGKNVILTGFPDCSGLHGEIHAMEGVLSNKLSGAVWGGSVASAGKVLLSSADWGGGDVRYLYADKSYIEFIQSTGVCHTVPGSYLSRVGIAPDSQLLRYKFPITDDGFDVGIFAGDYYHYGIFGTKAVENPYDAYLLKTWRAQYWQILEYYRRFFEYSPDETTPPFPTSAPVIDNDLK